MRLLIEGAVYGVAAAATYGASQFLIRWLIGGTGMAVMGALMTNVGATAFVLGMVSTGGRHRRMRAISGPGLRWFLMSGVSVTVAVVFRFVALERVPVTIVSSVNETSVFFGLMFNFLINRRVEAWGLPVFAAIGLSVAGTLVVTLL